MMFILACLVLGAPQIAVLGVFVHGVVQALTARGGTS